MPEASSTAISERTDAWLAQLLTDRGVITPKQVRALDDEPALWAAVVSRGWSSDDVLAETVAAAYRLPRAELSRAEARMAGLVPEGLARKHGVLPLSATDRRIDIATSDPRNLDLEQTLRFVTGRDVTYQIAPPAAIAEKLDELYRPERTIERLLVGLEPADVEAVEEGIRLPGEDPSLAAPVAKLVDALISDAVREGASDVHAEPTEGGFTVRYRIDGVLREVMRLPEAAGAALVRRVKIWAKLDVTDPLRPHDGRATARVDGQKIDLRVSTIPVARRGEKVVVRILDKTNLCGSFADLHLPTHEYAMLERLLGHREGIVLVTGPTGSGKTTTLYAAINQLKTGRVNIVTVEDPVEYAMSGISQIQVSEPQGLTFARALRSVLRQDPDIVLVGEIRDQETAGIAVQAALTGHLVLSTLHTNDAPSAITRLRDMQIDAYKLASVVKGIVAQRLVRRLCLAGAEPVDPASLPGEARPPAGRSRPAAVRRAVGCRACNGRGYRGRLAVLEILPVDEHVGRLIDRGALPDEVAAAARRLGMRTLWESGLERVWVGETSLDELTRVLGETVHEDAGIGSSPAPLGLRAEGGTPATAPRGSSPGAGTVPGHVDTAAGGARVLIADDDHQMRRLIRGVLEREGFAVTEAEDGLEALDQIEEGRTDLVVLDYNMPRLDGLGVLEELRARVRTASLPVIMLTASHGDTEEKALDLGAHDFLTKPVQTRSLVARVRAVLKRVSS